MTTTTPYASVRRVGGDELPTVLGVLTEAFSHDPLSGWLFPDERERGRLLEHFHYPLLAHPAGECYLTGGGEGAAVWLALPAGGGAPEEPQAPEAGSLFGEGAARLRALGEALAGRHPRTAHLYLACMGVAAEHRGAGLGSVLLRHRLERADAEGATCYLEASSPRSRALYLRHGFADDGAPVRVADAPPLWPMLRRPR
ncbi:GNAT family N-acetyltransferase [Nocardiopsis trehalosi]|jgi:GNAT superfamily N-acetyltransferase|uniref:GNAT family N-acetyltransferase n=1 Tax=Nocardiopsis trehalosi TaxID=109329 RepID=UPI0008354E8E|nr:GNAT family N-acetyltransferase [Nocardiopsis trehalosi]